MLGLILGAAALQLAAGTAFADPPHHLVEDSLQQGISVDSYRLTLWKYDPDTPQGQEPSHVPVGPIYIYPYDIRATGDPGIWEHYKIVEYYPANGQPIPGFKAIRQVKNFSNGLWYDEADVTDTWVP